MALRSREYRELVEALIERGYPKSPAIVDAFTQVDRSDFLPPQLRGRAFENVPLPIGFGQMTTEPFVIAFMLELLNPTPGANILEIGAGTGWQTALLAKIVESSGHVTAVEIIPELKTFCEQNLAKYHFENISLVLGDGSRGWPDGAPYDGITVSASVAKNIPREMIEQLKIGGRLVLPVGKKEQKLTVVERFSDREYREKSFPGFSFPVMLTSKPPLP